MEKKKTKKIRYLNRSPSIQRWNWLNGGGRDGSVAESMAAALIEDQDSNFTTHMVPHKHLYLQFQGNWHP